MRAGRDGGQLHHPETKTPGSDAPLPLPGTCTAAIKLQAEPQARWQADAGLAWHGSGLVISTRYGTPCEPRNFLRHFVPRCSAAQVRYIKPHGMRRTCASLVAHCADLGTNLAVSPLAAALCCCSESTKAGRVLATGR
jgi:integrase